MKRKNRDHVLAHDGSQGFYGFSCAHCGAKQKMPSLCELTVYVAASKAFGDNHANCQPRPLK